MSFFKIIMVCTYDIFLWYFHDMFYLDGFEVKVITNFEIWTLLVFICILIAELHLKNIDQYQFFKYKEQYLIFWGYALYIWIKRSCRFYEDQKFNTKKYIWYSRDILITYKKEKLPVLLNYAHASLTLMTSAPRSKIYGTLKNPDFLIFT